MGKSTSSSRFPPLLAGFLSHWQPWGCSSIGIASPTYQDLLRLAGQWFLCYQSLYPIIQQPEQTVLFVPFNTPKVPVAIAATFTLICFFIVGMSLYSDPWNTGKSCALTLTGIPVYYVTVHRFRLPNRLKRIFSKSYQHILHIRRK